MDIICPAYKTTQRKVEVGSVLWTQFTLLPYSSRVS